MSEPTQMGRLNRVEFVDRFVAEVLRIAKRPTFDDGDSIEDYARATGPSYWEEQYMDSDMSPEECAATDVSYWEASIDG